MSTPLDHAWFDAALSDALLDLLSDADLERFFEHARTCDSCTRRLAIAWTARDDWWAGHGHIPESGLLAIAEDAQAYEANMLEIIEAHLARCSECREDLSILRGNVADRQTTTPTPLEVPSQTPRLVWLPWSLAGAIAGAAAASLLMWSFIRQPSFVPIPIVVPTPPPRSAIAELLLPERIVIDAPSRDIGREATKLVQLRPGPHALSVVLPLLLLPDSTQCQLRIIGPDGTVTTEVQASAKQMFDSRGVLLRIDAAPGARSLQLHLSWLGENSTAHERVYHLRVETE